jgi:putative glutamine amidotransferase
MTLPLIAIPLDYLDTELEPNAVWYSQYPWYAIRHRYHDSLAKLGAMACFIGYEHRFISEYVNKFDALIIAGGHFDHDPELYGQTEIHPTIKRKSIRSQFEKELLKAFLPTRKPVLGICGGHQLINILYGGTLYQDIASQYKTDIKHTQTVPPTEVAHNVEIIQGTQLHEWYNQTHTQINSSHHQAIDQVGKGLVVNAVSEDDIIEGIEDPNHPFCVGVQWHPEYLLGPLDRIILEKFIASC